MWWSGFQNTSYPQLTTKSDEVAAETTQEEENKGE